MKRSSILVITLLITAAILFTSCEKNTPTTSPETNEAILTFIGPAGPEYLTMDQVKALPATEALGGIISSTGQITVPELYKGVSLKDLITHFAGSFDPSMGATLTAVDGYSMTYSYDQVMNGDFIAYDPALGTELVEHDPLTAILAYERAGQPLDSVQDGQLRLVIVSERNNQVTDGHWSIKWVNKVEVKTISATWTLDLEGAVLSEVDRGSFQSCASPGCHGVEWQDGDGQTWAGVPLWLLVGEVDDADRHSDYAFNEELAQTGYTVDVVAADGYSVSFDSLSIQQDGKFLVAYLLNASELPEEHYPLRLVGPDLENKQMVSQIVKIIVHVPVLTDTP